MGRRNLKTKTKLTVINNPYTGTLGEKGYGFIPQIVMRDRQISVTAKAIYSYLASFENLPAEPPWPDGDTIIQDLDITWAAFQRGMWALKLAGYIEYERIDQEIYITIDNFKKKKDDPKDRLTSEQWDAYIAELKKQIKE